MSKYDGMNIVKAVLTPVVKQSARKPRERKTTNFKSVIAQFLVALAIGLAVFGCKFLPFSFTKKVSYYVKVAVCFNLYDYIVAEAGA